MFKVIKNIFFKEQVQKLGIYGFGQLFNLITPLLVVPYIVAICGEENFGKTAVGMAVSFFIMVFFDFGSEISGVRAVAVNRENTQKLNEIFTTIYTVKTILFVPVIAIATLLFITVPYFYHEKAVFLLGISMLLGQLINPTWFLQGTENVKWITLLNIISKTFYLAGIFLFIKTPPDYIYINLLWGIGMIVAHSLLFFMLLNKYKFSFTTITKQNITSYFKKDFSIFYSQIFVSLQLNAPVVLVSFFGGNLMAGQYRIIEQIITIFKTYIFLFFNYVYPRVCFVLDKNIKNGLKSWLQFNGINFVFITFAMFILYLFSLEITAYFTSENTIFLAKIVPIAICLPLLLAISIPLKQLILAFNYKKEYVRLTTFSVLLSMILIVIGLQMYNLKGVFYSLLCTEILVIFYYIYRLKSKIRFL